MAFGGLMYCNLYCSSNTETDSKGLILPSVQILKHFHYNGLSCTAKQFTLMMVFLNRVNYSGKENSLKEIQGCRSIYL
ncbi:hypothetical protein SUGI_1125870 [Cryptomeria japonica]|nr:hypothetical protein SUGI_1125870 [Cryptomeria japonica]